jgi:hypothetical protein
MKTPIRFLFIILTLGLFSSCAEQFREIRGSENQGNAFLGGGLTSSTATKRTDKATGERVTPQQTVIPVEQAASDIEAQSAPAPNPIEPIVEKLETNQSRVITGQKGSVSSKHNSSSSPTLKKRKSLKPAKFLKQAISRKDNRNSAQSFLESPYFGGSIGDWLLYINVILSLIIIGLLLIYAFIDWTVLLGIIPALIPLGISLYQYLIRENLYEEGGLFRFSFWLIAASFFAQFIAYPLLIMQWTQNGPPIWYIIISALLVLGLGLHTITYIDKFFGYLFDSWSDKHWFVRLLLGIVFCLIAFIVLWALIYGSQI